MALSCLYFYRSLLGLPPQIKAVLFCLLVLSISQICTCFSISVVENPMHRSYIATGLGISSICVLICTVIIAFFSETEEKGRAALPSPTTPLKTVEQV